MKRLNRLLLGIAALAIVAGAGIFAAVRYLNSPDRGTPLVYSNNAMLLELWNDYKSNNIEAGSHRTLDRTQDNITTSEGESYTMERAVWMDDKTTFDQSWQFTQDNLQRSSDHLFSWKFGKRSDGTYGILTDIGGQNTASDADSDIALSLLMAYSRWNQPSYLYQAKQIITSIWNGEVVNVAGQPLLAADNLERNASTNIVVNPSYFAPYSFRLFAQVDPDQDWTGLLNNTYRFLNQVSSSPLNTAKSDGLPPDWITVNRNTGALIPAASSNLDTNYGYDAFRTPWRLALDYQWYQDPRDKALLSKFSFLGQQWQQDGKVETVYAHDGSVVGDYESPAAYGTAMGYFSVVEPNVAKQVYKLKLQPLYSPDRQQWKTSLAYYNDNWAWFGIALYQHALPNLAIENH